MSIAHNQIELGLKELIQPNFPNVYCSNIYEKFGNEEVRINLMSSSLLENNPSFETRNYEVEIRYYNIGQLKKDVIKNSIRNKTHRLYNLLGKADTFNQNWLRLNIETVDYNFEDEENETSPNLLITKYDLNIEAVDFLQEDVSDLILPEIPEGELSSSTLKNYVNSISYMMLNHENPNDYPITIEGVQAWKDSNSYNMWGLQSGYGQLWHPNLSEIFSWSRLFTIAQLVNQVW